MEYSIQEMSKLAGVTTRALRWYDKIGLLKPSRTAESGYRYYGPAEVDRLQDILYYRALGEELAALHRRWLTISGNQYDVDRHKGLAELYVADERFTAYYDRETDGCAQFLRDAILHWAGKL